MSVRNLILLIATALVSLPTMAETHTGSAGVIDGDGLYIDGNEYRLNGIDAVENDQGCLNSEGRIWLCGLEAKRFLIALIGNKPVTCNWKSTDRYKRRLGTCFVEELDLAEAMVRSGYAVAYRKYSTVYIPYEEQASEDKSGIWAGIFEYPEAHRRGGKKFEIPPPDTNRVIKGNINRKGKRYYHCPNDRSYSATKITEAKGEKWFSDSDAAESAGWVRAPNGGVCSL